MDWRNDDFTIYMNGEKNQNIILRKSESGILPLLIQGMKL